MGCMPCEPSDSRSEVHEVGTRTAFHFQALACRSAKSSHNTLELPALIANQNVLFIFTRFEGDVGTVSVHSSLYQFVLPFISLTFITTYIKLCTVLSNRVNTMWNVKFVTDDLTSEHECNLGTKLLFSKVNA